MSELDEAQQLPPDFSGVVRLFPLPNLVLFPHVVQPLRIFEPRYRELFDEALQTDRLITMGLLLTGWEKHYHQRPALAPVVCIGRVLAHHREANGDYQLLLLGLRRAAVEEEIHDEACAFRRARVRVLEDRYSLMTAHERPELQQRLIQSFTELVPVGSKLRRQFEQLLSSQMPLGPLTDVLAFNIGLPLEQKQQLLAELDVDRRAAMLLEWLPSVSPPRAYPPPFSDN